MAARGQKMVGASLELALRQGHGRSTDSPQGRGRIESHIAPPSDPAFVPLVVDPKGKGKPLPYPLALDPPNESDFDFCECSEISVRLDKPLCGENQYGYEALFEREVFAQFAQCFQSFISW
jgi:hypothetical protein